MTFNEFKILSPRKEQFDAENNLSAREKVEFVPKVSGTIERTILIKPKEEEILQHLDNKENAP